jgi:hypothetical protein
MAPERAHSVCSERSPFVDDDLRLMFNTPILKEKACPHDWQYRLALLGTGAGTWILWRSVFWTGARFKLLGSLMLFAQ